MALPYQTLRPTETVTVAGFLMPKRGCLTVAEMQAAADLDAETKEQLKEMTQVQTDLFLKQQIATILLRSRVDREWTIEKTRAPEWQVAVDGRVETIEPDTIMLDELFTFFMGEQRRWKEAAEPEAESTGKKPIGRKSTGS